MKPSPQRIREVYRYDPETGLFYWCVDNTRPGGKRYKAGDLAGSPATGKLGGWRLKLDDIEYPAAVIAFVIQKKRWPRQGHDVDHKDADRMNNRWRNLREATRMQNHANRRTFPHSSKYKGVGFDKQTGRWRASITKDRKLIALGRHDTEEQAHAAYERAARLLFGKFARTS